MQRGRRVALVQRGKRVAFVQRGPRAAWQACGTRAAWQACGTYIAGYRLRTSSKDIPCYSHCALTCRQEPTRVVE